MLKGAIKWVEGRNINADLHKAIDSAPRSTKGLAIAPWPFFGEIFGVAALSWEDKDAPIYVYRAKRDAKKKRWIKSRKVVRQFHCNPFCALLDEIKRGCKEANMQWDFTRFLSLCVYAVFFEKTFSNVEDAYEEMRLHKLALKKNKSYWS